VRATEGPGSGEGFFVTFPSGQIFTIGPTLARLDVDETGTARLRVVRGEIGLVTKPDGARSIPAGESLALDPEGKVTPGFVAAAPEDGFDYWSEQRDIALSTVTRPKQVPKEVVGAEDMDQYGDWVYSDTYKAEVWKPYVVEEWRPYSNGRWIYNSYSGWTWVPVEPWGYTTHHYGSWNYDPYYGWIWVPGATWYPARVSWVEYDTYVGWVPVGYYGYPVVTTYPYYVTTSYAYHTDLWTFTFVLADHFYYHHTHWGYHYYLHHHHYYHHGHHGHHGGHHGRHGDGDHHEGHHGDGDGHHGGGDGEHGGGEGHHGGGNGEGEAQTQQLHRWKGGADGRGGDRYTQAELKQWRERVNERGNGLENRSMVPISDKIDLDKLKNTKLQFASNVDKLDLEKRRQKGAAALQKVDHKKIVDVAGRPELQKKVAKLDSNPRRAGKSKAAAVSKGLPKRTVGDRAKRFDFRSSDLKIDKTRVKTMGSDRSDRRISTGTAKRSGDSYSRRNRTQAELNSRREIMEQVKQSRKSSPAVERKTTPSVRRITITDDDLKQSNRTQAELSNRREIMEQVKQSRKSSPAVGRKTTPSVQRISITDDDLKQTARRFKQERYNSRPIADERRPSQVAERRSQGRSSESRDMRRQNERETLSKKFGADRQTMGANSSASRERRSARALSGDSARTNRYDRSGSREVRQERSYRSSQRVDATDRRATRTPQVQSPRSNSYGETMRSHNYSRSSGMRSTQQRSRPTAPAGGMAQPQMTSPQPSYGGSQSIANHSGRGNFARGRATHSGGRSRANRR
jgi:hypothetical protein